jgi:RNA polymerase sigma factor (sigma-70 family)
MWASVPERKCGEDDRDMLLIQQGDGEVLQQLMSRWYGQMRKFHGSRQRVAEYVEFDDFFQEVSMRIWLRAATYRPGKFRSWIYCIANSIIVDAFRRKKLRFAEMPDCYDAADRGSPLDTAVEVIAERVHRYLQDRCGRDRGVAIGRLLAEECSTKECAELIGLSGSTVRWWRAYLVSELRNQKESLIREVASCV